MQRMYAINTILTLQVVAPEVGVSITGLSVVVVLVFLEAEMDVLGATVGIFVAEVLSLGDLVVDHQQKLNSCF